MERCSWAEGNELLKQYHDTEYGFAVSDDTKIFERLMLEIYQAGLSWRLVLEKRDGFKSAFYQFDIHKIAAMEDSELEKLRENPDIIRNKLKIYATRNNAKVALDLIDQYGSLLNYFSTIDYQINGDPKEAYKPVVKRMKQDGFKFIGPMILDEFFKSIGLVDVIHDPHCFLYEENSH